MHPGILDPSALNIVQYANSIPSKGFKYKLTDFTQCEHYGQISNDYMITLRRFAFPIGDDILNTVEFKTGNPKPIDITQPDLARAITWMSPALGNDLKEVMKFTVKYNWKPVESQLQTLQTQNASSDNRRGGLGAFMDGNSVLSAIEAGVNGYSADAAARKNMQQGGGDPLTDTYPNHVYGPLNVIKSVLIRDQGLEFEQEFSLKLHYNIKSYPNTSTRIAFLDTLANLLALTYSNAPFWGGATRYVGGGGGGRRTGKPFGDYDKLKNGDYAGFAGSVINNISSAISSGGKDLMGGLSGIVNSLASGDLAGAANGIGDSKILDNLIGGGLMKLFGGPTGAQGGQAAAALLSGDPSGQWHLTVGNPISPIIVVGNLAMTDASFEFEGPLTVEGFPTKVTMTVKLKGARPRDKAEIESMFNAGRGRLYLQPDVENSVNIDEVFDVSAYGNRDKKGSDVLIHRISNFAAG
jgi:hypothetical protein